ncbi:hypothetical protein A447_00591 [Fusobacterium vincentii ATCC 51190]|jgi:putative uncharacterized protein FNV1529|uniref:Uncharacterized protein n=1 Tax=Fusobacterium vincentii TaxID=155615 RepID=A0AAJ1CT29_FUSVC|nr:MULTISPECIES: hypothetical protein [Fusobacterium]EJG10112.1 hypothetical protein A447_00591 [Fusobacterium vincentii ATCC 51190]ERT46506.1 hypothetical protein HMPREF1768_00648 [Fusobacterium nucleatum CTI-7]MCW0263699.1 hypothetical protein [Fusobacterium vincentii]STO30262.1 Uncharacterised protein [Fusobacterium vincentii]
MIKKIIFYLVFSVISLAQQIELKSIEKTIIANGQNYTTTLSQSYDEKNKKLEVLYIEKADYPFGTKEIIQFDAEGKKELSKEKFKYNISTGNWNKDYKSVITYEKNKKIEETYMAEENRWTGYMKYESENTDNSETFIIYNFKNKKWNPFSKTYTLLNEDKKNNIIETYNWDINKQKWDLESKSVYTYNQEGKLEETVDYKKENNWIADQKLKYYTDNKGNQVYSNLFFQNGKWIEQDKTISEIDKVNNKKVAITQQLNKETKQLENTRRFIQTYKNDMIEQEVQYSWDKDEKKWYKNYEQNYFYNKNKKLIRQQAFFNDGSGVQFTYKFDKNGNNVEILTENLNTKTKLWKLHEKIEYLYDLSITKDKVIDRGNINDEKEDSANPILEKRYYLYDDKKWILAEKTKYLYDKK